MITLEKLKRYEAALRRWKTGQRPKPSPLEFGLGCCGNAVLAKKLEDQIEAEYAKPAKYPAAKP